MGEKQKRRPVAPKKKLTSSDSRIRTAFAKLLNEKDINRITVSDIVREADICRGTFYSYYLDVFDLYEQVEKECINDIVAFIEEEGITDFLENPKKSIDRFISYVNRNREYYRLLLLSTGVDEFSKRLSALFAERLLDEISVYSNILSRPEIMVYLSFLATAVKGVLLQWISGKYDLMSDEQFSDVLSSLITGATQAFMQRDDL